MLPLEAPIPALTGKCPKSSANTLKPFGLPKRTHPIYLGLYSLAFHYNTAATISPKVFIFIDDSDKEGSIDPAYVQSFISRE
ncbi:MAG: hypothetical protein WCA35_15820, partial [Kovacikia sp.]